MSAVLPGVLSDLVEGGLDTGDQLGLRGVRGFGLSHAASSVLSESENFLTCGDLPTILGFTFVTSSFLSSGWSTACCSLAGLYAGFDEIEVIVGWDSSRKGIDTDPGVFAAVGPAAFNARVDMRDTT